MKIYEYLEKLGCNKAESETLEALLGISKGCGVLELSRKLNVARPTLYGHIDTLIEKGLVKKGLGDHGALFYAESIENIHELFQERAKQLEISGELLKKTWQENDTSNTYRPKFILFENENAAETVLRDVLRSREKESLWFWPVKEMLRVVSEEALVTFNEERVARNMRAKVLWPCQRAVDIDRYAHVLGPKSSKSSLRSIRVLPKYVDATMGYCVYGNKVACISSVRENYGFIVDSKEFSHMHRSQFAYLWRQSERRS